MLCLHYEHRSVQNQSCANMLSDVDLGNYVVKKVTEFMKDPILSSVNSIGQLDPRF